MVRLILTLTPIVCVASAIALSNLLETYLVEEDEVEHVDDEVTVPASKKKGTVEPKEEKVIKQRDGIKSGNLKYPIVAGVWILLSIFGFHCTYVTDTAYSSPSVVLASRNRDGSQLIIVR